MNYNDYRISRNLAWEIMINEHITELPVSMVSLCQSLSIHLAAHSGYIGDIDSDGASTIDDSGRALIIYNAQQPLPRKRFTIAHEIGHIMLGHVGRYRLVNREPSPQDNPIEQAANVFASRLLAPACILWALDIHTPQDIAAICGISLQAAEFRAVRMDILYKRNKFLTSPLERQVYEQFAPFIKKHMENYKPGS